MKKFKNNGYLVVHKLVLSYIAVVDVKYEENSKFFWLRLDILGSAVLYIRTK